MYVYFNKIESIIIIKNLHFLGIDIALLLEYIVDC